MCTKLAFLLWAFLHSPAGRTHAFTLSSPFYGLLSVPYRRQAFIPPPTAKDDDDDEGNISSEIVDGSNRCCCCNSRTNNNY